MRQRIAIVHDNLLEFGGSERVLLEILRLYPHADLFTFFFSQHNPQIQKYFGRYCWQTSVFQHLQFLAKLAQYFSLLKPFAWWYFAHLDLSDYDLVVTSSHSYNSKLVHTGSHTKHVCYLYTPPRFLYGYAHELKGITHRSLFTIVWKIMRWIDTRAAQKPDLLIVSSKEIQWRVQQIYQRSSVIVHPPSPQISVKGKRDRQYYVAHSRLVRQKHIGLIVEACTKFNLPLKVIGDGYLKDEMARGAGQHVEFLGFVPDRKLPTIYRHAKALIYAAEHEDFGIVPIEAQSAGIPVLAYRSGGVLETVREGITGYFFRTLSVRSLMQAIKKLEQHPLSARSCTVQARKFDRRHFAHNFREHVRNVMAYP